MKNKFLSLFPPSPIFLSLPFPFISFFFSFYPFSLPISFLSHSLSPNPAWTLGSAVSSLVGSARSPAEIDFFLHFKRKIWYLVRIIFSDVHEFKLKNFFLWNADIAETPRSLHVLLASTLQKKLATYDGIT